ncbi:hypothetical protein [Natronococcus occultus]|uniref:hypothetical protein n=1 Tax=Natronococcus occultus TaxID=29288 RepID=UPI0006776C00|nr:hypothetical protein [Natronococcus occultus]
MRERGRRAPGATEPRRGLALRFAKAFAARGAVLGIANGVQNQTVTVQQLQRIVGTAAATTMRSVLEDGLESQGKIEEPADGANGAD